MSIVIDFIANLGLEAVRDKITDTSVEVQVKEHIAEYLSRQQRINMNVSLEEEIDFGGLSEYIQTDLMEDVKRRLFGNKSERRSARQTILNKAVSFSTANTKISAHRTMKIIGDAIDILRDYYRNRVNRDLLFITTEIEETVVSEHEETRALVVAESKKLEAAIKDDRALSVDSALQKIDAGNVAQLERQFGKFMNAISAGHELFPDFGFRMTAENKMVSVPLNDEARIKYPENFKITATAAKIGNQPIGVLDKATFDQAYRHQLPIYIDVQKAAKYLGAVLDPIQAEAEKMTGSQMVVYPPKFPPAFPCNVIVGSDVLVPYLLLRTKELLDDGSVIIANEEQQNFNFDVSLHLYPKTQKLTFTVKPKAPSNNDSLQYRRFLKRVLSGEQVTVNALSLNEQFIRGTVDKKDMGMIDEEIEFLEKIVMIEEYFCTPISIPEVIKHEDHLLINRICDLIQGGFTGSWDKFDFKFIISQETKDRILSLIDTAYTLAYSGEGSFSLFEQEFTIPIFREIESAKIENLSHLKKKIEVLDVGDEIKVTYIPGVSGSKGKYIDKIKTQDIEDNLVFAKEE